MIKFLEKYYKLAPNGKVELLGKDGLNHGVIDAAIMLTVGLLTWFISGYNPFITKIALGITWIIMRIVWYGIEVDQALKMQKANPTRLGSAWDPRDWSPARIVDNTWPLKLGTPVLLAGLVLL